MKKMVFMVLVVLGVNSHCFGQKEISFRVLQNEKKCHFERSEKSD
jgi:hypothetical protein